MGKVSWVFSTSGGMATSVINIHGYAKRHAACVKTKTFRETDGRTIKEQKPTFHTHTYTHAHETIKQKTPTTQKHTHTRP